MTFVLIRIPDGTDSKNRERSVKIVPSITNHISVPRQRIQAIASNHRRLGGRQETGFSSEPQEGTNFATSDLSLLPRTVRIIPSVLSLFWW